MTQRVGSPGPGPPGRGLSATLTVLKRHGVAITLAVLCSLIWVFLLLNAGDRLDWRPFAVFAVGVLSCLQALRLERRRDRAIRAADPPTARRLEAHAFPWDDRRMKRILSDVRRDEGADVASQLEAEIATIRAATPLLLRPVRGFGYLAALAVLLVVFGLVVLLNR